MVGIPRGYDPSGRDYSLTVQVKALPAPSEADGDKPATIRTMGAFGRNVQPPEDTIDLPPICPHECRLIEFGGCDGPCRLTART